MGMQLYLQVQGYLVLLDLISKTFVFIGFSFEDPNLDSILNQIRLLLDENIRNNYCFMKRVNILVRWVLPQLSVFLLPHIAQFCFQQLSVTFSVHSTFYHFEPAVSSLYKTIAIVISYRIFNSIQIVFQTFSKTS